MRIAVYCSASTSIDQKYLDLAFDLGSAIALAGDVLLLRLRLRRLVQVPGAVLRRNVANVGEEVALRGMDTHPPHHAPTSSVTASAGGLLVSLANTPALRRSLDEVVMKLVQQSERENTDS